MNKTIVITSIFSPTEAVLKFSSLRGYRKIVVGDKKTPADWYCKDIDYISIEQQESMSFELSGALPVNHYCRKMLGYLKAVSCGADIIIDTDDDNIPKNNWGFPGFEGSFQAVPGDNGFVNIYQLFTDQKIWPRGLPLDLITKSFELDGALSASTCNVGIWQGLADEDPDVDAIYRLTNDEPCNFRQREPVVLQKGTICPFNTQNTAMRKELFPLMYLPTYVTFRFTDILRGLVAQPIMWLYDYHLGFINATVVQKRNPHDYMEDFISEIPMYKHCRDVVDLVFGAISSTESIEGNLYNSYKSLLKENIVCGQEIRNLEIWLEDLQDISGSVSI